MQSGQEGEPVEGGPEADHQEREGVSRPRGSTFPEVQGHVDRQCRNQAHDEDHCRPTPLVPGLPNSLAQQQLEGNKHFLEHQRIPVRFP